MDDKRDEIIARLKEIQQGLGNGNPKIPLIDPTANVLSLVGAAIARQDDLREQYEKYQDKLAEQRRMAETEARQGEARRIDALLAANTNNVALALEKQGAQAQAQDKRIAALEQNQYQGVGAGVQRGEGRQVNQWAIGVALFILAVIVGHFWK